MVEGLRIALIGQKRNAWMERRKEGEPIESQGESAMGKEGRKSYIPLRALVDHEKPPSTSVRPKEKWKLYNYERRFVLALSISFCVSIPSQINSYSLDENPRTQNPITTSIKQSERNTISLLT